MLSGEQVKRQSEGAFGQWGETWEKNCKTNAEILKKKGKSNFSIFGHGLGRSLICVAMGASLEDEVDKLKVVNPAVDIACVDKAFGYLLDHGVKPKFVFLADAGISYEENCKPWIEQTEDISLFLNVCANPIWAENWKGNVFYYVNEDNIKTQDIYSPLSGCKELVKASSNVGNSVIVYANSYLHYDRYFLAGYDFCWGENDNYYCNKDTDKRFYMNHNQVLQPDGTLVYTSNNLMFSVRWLSDYINVEMIPKGRQISKIGKKGLINIPPRNLERVLKTEVARQPEQDEIDQILNTRALTTNVKQPDDLNKELQGKRVMEVIIRHLPEDPLEEVA